ncbi:hypothetical protein ACFODZ_00105 [Marinicella sediminis]|uniref:WG repeat-containing protein n=1 Tax=Marinicella sediminis TaxID=1792834 RepID=A0ABV7JB15_9GAMM|nr:hypothetical protein [Marinicella sediminis]
MPEMNTIIDKDGKIIAFARHGIGWLKVEQHIRLGEYDYGEEGFVYSNDGEKTASFGKGLVKDLSGKELGRYENHDLMIDGQLVGRCIGFAGVAALALVFIFQKA